MGLTPVDIHNKEFERSFRGYLVEDVNEFLDQIAKDMEQLAGEYGAKEQVNQLNEKLKVPRSWRRPCITPPGGETAEEVKQNASREADLIRAGGT